MNQQGPGIIRPMISADLETVLEWRNHENVRRFMYTQHKIRMEEHSRWFERSTTDNKQHLLIFEANAKPMGFVSLHETALGGIADWGFYTAPDAPPGTGSALGHTTSHHAFIRLGLHKLCGQALAFNKRSIQFHLKLGFLKEGVLQQQHFDGQHYHDVWCFGLLASAWQAKN